MGRFLRLAIWVVMWGILCGMLPRDVRTGNAAIVLAAVVAFALTYLADISIFAVLRRH